MPDIYRKKKTEDITVDENGVVIRANADGDTAADTASADTAGEKSVARGKSADKAVAAKKSVADDGGEVYEDKWDD